MKTQHTKGEWKVLNFNGTFNTTVMVGDNECICETYYNNDNYSIEAEEAEANAKLIAAAPELLTIANLCLNWFEWNNGEIDIKAVPASAEHILPVLREVINKATE